MSTIKANFVLHSAIEGYDKDYKVFDVIILKTGPGKKEIFLEDMGGFFRESFPDDILTQLMSVIEGTPIEAYRVAGTKAGSDDGLVHPSPVQAAITPEGLVAHGIGVWKDVRIAPHPEGGNALWGKAVLNETRMAVDVGETIKQTLQEGSSFVPAPSINGYMLWEPIVTEEGQKFLMARELVNLRSTEMVNRPAAGGKLFAVVEGNVMNMFTMLKSYCQANNIAFDAAAADVTALLASVPDKNDTLTSIETSYNAEDESAALAVLSSAMETTPQQTTTAVPATPPAAPLSTPAPSLSGSPASIPPTSPTPAMPDQSAILAPAMQGIQTLTGMVQNNQSQMASIAELLQRTNARLDERDAKDSAVQNKTLMLSYIQESEDLADVRKTFWKAQVEAGKVTDIDVLKGFVADDAQSFKAFTSQVTEGVDSLNDLPTATQHLLNIVPQEDKPYISAKLLFGAPLSEGEKNMASQAGIRSFESVAEMYHTMVPGDPAVTGMAFEGKGAGYSKWLRSLPVMQGIAGEPEVSRRSDFTGILLDIVTQIGLKRWDMQQLDALDLCSVGPNFMDFEDTRTIITGGAPPMKRWNSLTGYQTLDTGQRKKVDTTVDPLGGILRWARDVILNDRNGSALNIIQTDVNNAIDATYEAIIQAIVDGLMGWTDTGINTKSIDDDGILYQTGAPRQNYVSADGREYNTIVNLVNLMFGQTDIKKDDQPDRPLIMTPGGVLCVWGNKKTMQSYFSMENKPGTDSEPNPIGGNGTPIVAGVHREFLHKYDSFACVIPDPKMQPVIQIQYFRGRKRPSVIWQNQPNIGRVFENGEIAAQLDMPVRVTLLRSKGTFGAWSSSA